MSDGNDTQVLGIVVLARGGDRQTLYLDPDTYFSTLTTITPLGEQQEFQLGASLRSLYLNASSPSFIGIPGVFALVNQSSVIVRADEVTDDGTLFDSAVALMQGFWPPTAQSSISLANGTTITSPLNGFQYVNIESVDPDMDYVGSLAPPLELSDAVRTFLQAWSNRVEQFYNSAAFVAKANESASFLTALQPYIDARISSLQDIIYDYMNVQFTYNITYAEQLPPRYLEQVRDLVNWHEYNLFTDSQASGIGNIAGRSILPTILDALSNIGSQLPYGLQLHFSAVSYQPFLSLMNMTGIFESGQLPPAIVDYAAALVFEVRQSTAGGEPVIRVQFKNGTDDDFHAMGLIFDGWNGSGGKDVPLSVFTAAFQGAAVNTTADWCNICAQPTQRSCEQALASPVATAPTSAASSSSAPSFHSKQFSSVGAGFLGAGLAIVLLSAVFGLLLFLGVLSYGGVRKLRRLSNVSRRSNREWRGDEMELHSEV
ncbi:hypothetical protein PHLCEN_2v3375 [Hermanssonia centrifuga]|uniref:Uncharacterized protein n=1 Tax=Hermanssonia centrifuga TaxID=98765 RepID=A0A2R6QIV9_9APHY|nr:hypothetical protein PHLCEN_2v3375 [Hermanssonia centrifuga]